MQSHERKEILASCLEQRYYCAGRACTVCGEFSCVECRLDLSTRISESRNLLHMKFN